MSRHDEMIRHQQEQTAQGSVEPPPPSDSEKGLSGMTKDLLLKEHPELAAQAGLVKQTKVNKEKKRKQYYHEGINCMLFPFQDILLTNDNYRKACV